MYINKDLSVGLQSKKHPIPYLKLALTLMLISLLLHSGLGSMKIVLEDLQHFSVILKGAIQLIN
jgi:succinate dehydrogenase hydrophobic anchor subunit